MQPAKPAWVIGVDVIQDITLLLIIMIVLVCTFNSCNMVQAFCLICTPEFLGIHSY